MQNADLFADIEAPGPVRETMGEGAVLLRGKALPLEDELIAALAFLAARSPFRRMATPGGFVMSVAMTNCGAAGWVTDRTGYRYDRNDPETGEPWPEMPDAFRATCGRGRCGSRVSKLHAGRLPDQPLRARRAAVAPPGQERARFRQSYRFRLAWTAGHLPVRGPETDRSGRQICAEVTATSQCGAARRGFATTEFRRSRMVSTRSSGACGSI